MCQNNYLYTLIISNAGQINSHNHSTGGLEAYGRDPTRNVSIWLDECM